jgi:hypothetical protein
MAAFASEPQLGAYWVAKLGELVNMALRNLNVPEVTGSSDAEPA